MRVLFILLLSALSLCAPAQSTLKKSYTVPAGASLVFKFDYPQQIKIETWEGNQVLITGTVSINNGNEDEAFQLSKSMQEGKVVIEGKIPDLKSLTKAVIAVSAGDTIRFSSQEEYRRYAAAENKTFEQVSTGPDISIQLQIKVPKSLETKVESTYGIVEVSRFEAPLHVQATYGGVDAKLQVRSVGKLIAETNFGTIYSNLDIEFQGAGQKDFHTLITSSPGKGPLNHFESKFGNVYLRK